MGCLNCGAELVNLPKKRQKIFCNNTCRSNYWQKNKRLEEEGLSVDEIIKRMKLTIRKNKKQISATPKVNEQKKEEGKHQLWKQGDPAEGTSAFYLKYGCYTYKNISQQTK